MSVNYSVHLDQLQCFPSHSLILQHSIPAPIFQSLINYQHLLQLQYISLYVGAKQWVPTPMFQKKKCSSLLCILTPKFKNSLIHSKTSFQLLWFKTHLFLNFDSNSVSKLNHSSTALHYNSHVSKVTQYSLALDFIYHF